MKKALFCAAISLIAAATVVAEDNILAEKPIYTLGEAKTWTGSNDATYTFKTAELSKLVAVPTNTAENVYLFPEEGGVYNTDANKAIGIQGFYVDMEAEKSVGLVSTTWEGAAANAYNIYLTNEAPTTAILETTPVYTASGLGQYTSNTATLPSGSKGRYLVFQATDATNWGWGVKIRSIAAYEPAGDILTSFSVSPAIVSLNAPTAITMSCLNQFGTQIDNEKLQFTVSDNATLENGLLTAVSGNTVTVSAKLDDITLESVVYIASVAPAAPAAAAIKTPVFTNTVTEYNDKFGTMLAYNGGAVSYGKIEYEDGSVAWAFGNTRCVFFCNSETTGAWDADIDPTALGYATLHLDIFGTKDVTGNVTFELANTNNHPFTLEAGKWTSVDVDLTGETNLHTMSVRFDEANKSDILLANIYFTAAFVEGDEEAPVLSDITVLKNGRTAVTLNFSATDDKSDKINYVITAGENTYSTVAASGEEVTYIVKGLQPDTEYTLAVTAGDGKNVSAAKTVTTTTEKFPDVPELGYDKDSVVAIYSSTYGKPEGVIFNPWNSSAKSYEATTESGNKILVLTNYYQQWGGLIGYDVRVENMTYLHIDIFGDAEEGTLKIAPVWQGVGNTPGKVVTVAPNQWNSINIPLSELGKDMQVNNVIYQFSMSESTLNDFAIDNVLLYQDKDPNAIRSVEIGAQSSEVVYDLQGRRVANPTNGLYIINGKKVIK